MIAGKSVVAFIPARGGSKRLPRKNMAMLGAKPLIGWTIEAARAERCVDHVVLSSEDDEILAVASSLGAVPVRRPENLACDTARTIHVLHEFLKCQEGGFDYMIQLQPTSPFRLASDIDDAMDVCIAADAPACVSVCPVRTNPHNILRLSDDRRLQPILPLPAGVSRHQDMPAFYKLNGAIYAARTDWIASRDSFLSPETVAYVMPRERSLDIDEAEDLLQAELRLQDTFTDPSMERQYEK